MHGQNWTGHVYILVYVDHEKIWYMCVVHGQYWTGHVYTLCMFMYIVESFGTCSAWTILDRAFVYSCLCISIDTYMSIMTRIIDICICMHYALDNCSDFEVENTFGSKFM